MSASDPSASPRPGSAPPMYAPSRAPRRRSWSWRALFRPFRTDREGTMPAGLVLVIVVLALLVAMFLNADATLRKSRAKGSGFRQEVAQTVANVSDAVGLNFMRNRIDEAMGRTTGGTGGESIDQLLAEKQAAEGQGDQSTASTGGSSDGTQQAVGASTDTKPTLRTPTQDNPLVMWVGGDSVGGSFGVQMQPIAADTGIFDPILDYKVGTGITRPEYYNWPEHIAKDVIPKQNPDIMVAMFGANDDQDMTVDGQNLKKYTPEWYAEYRKRIGQTMDLMKSPEDDRLVVWVGVPPPGPGSHISNMDKMNYIFWSEAQKRPWVSYVDTWAFMGGSGPDYKFVGSMPTASGKVTNMYQRDNLHLATTGARYLSWGVLGHLSKILDLSQSKIPTYPPDEAPPATIQERTELPAPEGMQ